VKVQFEIKQQHIIDEILNTTEYGTLALCKENKPYSVPINFVYIDDSFYFHGNKKGKKMEYIHHNPNASLSIAKPYAVIPSYFSSKDDLACPASHFFQSISIDGTIEIIKDFDEKVFALQSLMQKLQPEGRYLHLSDDKYLPMIEKTEVFKLIPTNITGKVKLAQHLPKERYDMIIDHLQKRGDDLDMLTIKKMQSVR
jgi:nitroimidazol reductase NimA-like FMN-containing flavoprotein (pyridoxamine 5'-phosphate oxidase superfamily)